MAKIRIVIVDDSVICRDVLRTALSDLPDIDVCAVSPTGQLGLLRTKQLKPDLVILASSLEDLGAPEFTRVVQEELASCGVLVTSANDRWQADMAIQALEAGAFDFVLKPREHCVEEDVAILRRMLLPKIRCFSIRHYSRVARSFSPAAKQPALSDATRKKQASVEGVRSKIGKKLSTRDIEAVVVGASTGGPEALLELIPALPASFPVPIIIVLHMPKLFTGRMAHALDQHSALTISEGEDGDVIKAGHVYLAPGGAHLTVERGTRRQVQLRITDAPSENGCRPSIDVFFRTAAEVFRNRTLAILLTGMGEDGARGLKALKKRDASVLVQDEETSVVWGMPGSAVNAGCVDEVLPLGAIAGRMLDIVGSI